MTYRIAETPHDPNALLLGGKVYSRRVTIVSGQNLAAGAVLGQITTGGKFALSAAAASDGSQTPKAILPVAVDASGGDRTVDVYLAGDFDGSKCVFGAGHTIASTAIELSARGIYLYAPLAS